MVLECTRCLREPNEHVATRHGFPLFLDSHYLDVCHEKALLLMRQLYFVEGALLNGDVFGESTTPRETHLRGVLAIEAEMIVVDII